MKDPERKEDLLCINCPAGCRMKAVWDGAAWKVSGNQCRRGELYAVQELTDPRRVLTCLMRVRGYEKPVSVKTDRGVPKKTLLDCAREIYRNPANGPVCAGDVLIRNILGTGADVIATRDLKE